MLIRFKIGAGNRVKFWTDIWCCDQPLCSLVPNLFSVSTQKHASVADYFVRMGDGEQRWELSFTNTEATIPDNEVGLLSEILVAKTPTAGEDKIHWLDGSEKFNVNICYKKILGLRLKYYNGGVMHYNWKRVWSISLPKKIKFFNWLVVRNKILMQNSLKNRGFALAEKCVMCDAEGENLHHLLCS